MSNIGQSIIDTPIEDELDAAYTLEPITPEDEAEAMEQQAVWSAVTTLEDYLWEINIVIDGIRYSALITSKEQPDHRQAAAAVATIYSSYNAQQFIDLIVAGKAVVVTHHPRILNTDDIQTNYIPF